MKSTRWQQRFENFEKSFVLLRDTFKEKPLAAFSDLEKEGIVQRFECAFELAWKTLNDYLSYTGFTLEQVTPRHIIKQAFAANIISNGNLWIDMLESRNLMSHTYDKKKFEKITVLIANEYLPALEQIYLLLKAKDSSH